MSLANTSESLQSSEVATLAGGCFWCIEVVFLKTKGVCGVQSGYMGGEMENPTYEAVCGGQTGHAEVVQVTFDPAVLGYGELLDVFWNAHDPTTLNRQGNDQGTQYRSAIFYHSEEQRSVAEASVGRLNEAKLYSDPVVSEIVPASEFYPAEAYHDDYYRRNREAGYCQFVIRPKLEKLGLE